MKKCSNCSVEQPDHQFYERAGRPGVLHSWCKNCTLELRRKRNPEIAEYQRRRRKGRSIGEKGAEKDYQLQYRFGISLEQYQRMLKEQDYKCAICKKENGLDRHSKDRSKELSVDHNHKTGHVRGLLCNDCNRAIGQLQDSSELLRKAASYLDCYDELQKGLPPTATRRAEIPSADSMLDELSK